MEIQRLLDASDHDYETHLNRIMGNPHTARREADKLDDALLTATRTRPIDVERVCRINQRVFARTGRSLRTTLLAYNYNTLCMAVISQNDFAKTKQTFLEGVTFCRNNNQGAAGQSICQNMAHAITSQLCPADEALPLLRVACDFFVRHHLYTEAIDVLCNAAQRFADVRAFQSAYRALKDAQDISIPNRLEQEQLKILETQGQVALLEGDLKCAENDFATHCRILTNRGERPSIQLLANNAYIKLQKEEYLEAAQIYKSLIDEHVPRPDDKTIQLFSTNLLVCYRELGNEVEAMRIATNVEAGLTLCNLEHETETHLVLAKTYQQFIHQRDAERHIKNLCTSLDRQMAKYRRLHYRRGLRERFVPRVKEALAKYPDEGDASAVLEPLLLTSANMLLDWLAALQWVQDVEKRTEIPVAIRHDLHAKLGKLVQFGAPYIYGYHEKYDDPFNIPSDAPKDLARQADFSLPWREFNESAVFIEQTYGLSSPFGGASITECAKRVHKLSVSAVLLFSFVCQQQCCFFIVSNAHYTKIALPLEKMASFYVNLNQYQTRAISRTAFIETLSDISESLKEVINRVTKTIEETQATKLVHIADVFTETLPILPGLLESETIRERILASHFGFCNCEAIIEPSGEPVVSGPAVAMFNKSDDLVLLESELRLVRETLPDGYEQVDLGISRANFGEPPLRNAHLLHVAKHCVTPTMFTDPHFATTAGLSGKNGIFFEEVQEHAPDMELELVVLNGCNTGTAVNKNFFKTFDTSEKVGLPTCFLLNRKCAVIATTWNLPETPAFVFAKLLYKRLKEGRNTESAFICTLLDMYNLTVEGFRGVIETIDEPTTRKERLMQLVQFKKEYPFRSSYLLGVQQYHSLLPYNTASEKT